MIVYFYIIIAVILCSFSPIVSKLTNKRSNYLETVINKVFSSMIVGILFMIIAMQFMILALKEQGWG